MSIYDLQKRAEIILKKYEKYDAPIKTKSNSGNDPFMDEYEEIESEVEKVMEAAGDVALESNRAVVAAKNAEIRRAKNVLLTEAIASLQKKIKKGKGVTKPIIEERQLKINELIDKIYAIPDGMSMAANRRPNRYTTKGKKGPAVNLSLSNASENYSNPLYYSHTDQTQAFQKEWDTAKEAQDKRLDNIGKAVGDLQEMARGMGEELDKQAPVIDDIEQNLDKVTNSLKTNNMKLKGIVENMRSSRNFCVDLVLITVLLAIGAYLFTMFR